MINIEGELIQDSVRIILPNAWGDHDFYRAKQNELVIVHALCAVNLDTGAETVSAAFGIGEGERFHYHHSKVAFGINASMRLAMPMAFRDGQTLRVKLYASAADTPVNVTYQAMVYPIRKKV